MARHDFAHVLPPAPAGFGLRNRLPPRLAFEFDVSEQVAGVLIEKDRVSADAVREQRFFQLRPDRAVPPGVFGVLIRMHGHSESFANHDGANVPERRGFITPETRLAIPGETFPAA